MQNLKFDARRCTSVPYNSPPPGTARQLQRLAEEWHLCDSFKNEHMTSGSYRCAHQNHVEQKNQQFFLYFFSSFNSPTVNRSINLIETNKSGDSPITFESIHDP